MDWFKANQLSINLDKTVMMYFWPNSGNINVKVGDYEIPVVPFTKFLGVFLDESMSWKYYAEHLHNKLLMNKQLLTTSKNKLDCDSLQKVYFSHIHSHLTYGIKAWGPSLCTKKLEDLFKQQRKCIQVICSAKSTTPINFLFKELRILKLHDMIALEQSKLGYQLKNKLLPKPLQILFHTRGGEKKHHYPTRNKTLPNVQKHSGKSFNASLMYMCITSHSKLPFSIQRVTRLHLFAQRAKYKYLADY